MMIEGIGLSLKGLNLKISGFYESWTHYLSSFHYYDKHSHIQGIYNLE